MAEQQIMTSPAMTGTPIGDGGSHGGAAFGRNFDFPGQMRQLFGQPAVQRALPAIGMVGAVAMAGAAWWSLQSPDMMPLYQGLSDVDKSEISQALDGAGIDYDFNDNTGAIEVSEDEVRKTRMLLAGKGLPKAAPQGDAILANLPMGASRSMEGEALRSARESDIARTVEAIDVVEAARVHLAIPEASAFVRETSPAAASVMVSLYQGRTLSGQQINSIRYLVASSVPELAPEQVSIVDQNGNLLTGKDYEGGDENLRMQMLVEDRYRTAVMKMLTPIVGKDNFSTEVHVELDLTESQATRERFPEEDRVLKSEQGNKRMLPGGADGGAGGGIPGALANQPPPASQLTTDDPGIAGVGGGAQQSEETYSRNFDLGREISVTHKPQGDVERVTVAVALRQNAENKLSDAEVGKIEKLVESAVGYREERGDVVTVQTASFVTPDIAKPAFWDQPWFMPLMRQVGAVLIAVLLFLFVGRPLIKRMRSASHAGQAAATLKALARETQRVASAGTDGKPDPKLAQLGPKITLEMIEAAPTSEMKTELVRHFVKQDTRRAAEVVRELMQEHKHG